MTERRPDASKRTAGLLLGVVGVMLGASFAAVPLYDIFCRVTGFGGTTQVAENANETPDVRPEIASIRFDASINQDLPWRFAPVKREVKVHIGETGLAYYRATNFSDKPVAGTAVFNVTPLSVGAYFVKIDCFCFTEQVLAPGETVDMPVTFYVDPEILDDPETKDIRDITLSYTFYKTDLPTDYAAALN